MSEQHDTIDALMAENRTFPPPDWFKDEALVVGQQVHFDGLIDGGHFFLELLDLALQRSLDDDTAVGLLAIAFGLQRIEQILAAAH